MEFRFSSFCFSIRVALDCLSYCLRIVDKTFTDQKDNHLSLVVRAFAFSHFSLHFIMVVALICLPVTVIGDRSFIHIYIYI